MKEDIKMKIRNGFVSNSSSCNFMIIGFKVPYNYIDYTRFPKGIDEIVDKINNVTDLKIGYLTNEPDFLIGDIVYDNSDAEPIEIDLERLHTSINTLSNLEPTLKDIFGISPVIKIISGERSC
jgi:hypothetical protein